jgi:diguanylate cyclase (GGDEF)-like protein
MGQRLWACLTGLLALCVLGSAHAQAPAQVLPQAPQSSLIILAAPQAAPALEGRALWWVDPSASRRVDEVEAAVDTLPWAVHRPGQQLAIDGKALWIRFDAQLANPGRWFVALRSSGLDRAQLFYRDASGRWVEQEAGDTRPVSEWPLPGRIPTFELSPEVGKPVRYWLRVEHARVDFAVPVGLHHQGELLADREREQFLLGAYFGLALLIALTAAANAVVYRDRSFATYAVYVSALALGQAAYMGVGAQHLWNEALRWNEVAAYVLPGLSSAAALWFVHTVTEPGRFSRALALAVWGLIAAILATVAVDTWLASRATFGLQMALTILAILVVVFLIVVVWVQGDVPYIRLIALGFLPVVIFAVFPVLRGLNVIPNSVLTRYGVAIGSMIEMPILFYALSLRVARRREAEVRAAALERNDALTGLAHGRTLLQRLDGALTRARSLKHFCALLTVRISNFEAIVQEFGAESADKMLVVAASHLRRASSDIDMPARVNERDFALLLEGPTTAAAALSRAQLVVASGLRQAGGLPAGMVLKFHVAVALLPERDMGAAATLQWLLEALSTIAPDARKLIKPVNF